MPTLPPLGQSPNLAGLETFLEEDYPGGKKIRPTYDEGPFWLVPLFDASRPTWTQRTILAAYPAITHVTSHDSYDRFPLSLHAVPDFARRALEWDAEDGTLSIEDDAIAGPYEQMPGWAQIAVELPNYVSSPDADSSIYDAFAEAHEHVGPAALLQLLAALDDEVLTDPDALETVVRGTCTPSVTAQTA